MMRYTSLFLACNITLFAESVLTLEKAYEYALKNHPGYRVEKFKNQAVEESVRQAKSRLFPKIDISASGGKYEYEAYYNGIETSEVYKNYSLSLTQPLFRPELWRAVDQVQTRYDASAMDLDKEAQKIGLDVVKTYMELLKVQSALKDAELQKRLYDTKLARSSEMIGMGLSNNVELQQAKVEKEKASIDLMAKKREFATLKSRLERLTKASFEAISDYDQFLEANCFSMSKSEWMDRLKGNKDILIAKLSRKIADHEVAIRRYDHYPKADLSLGRSQNYTDDPVAHKYDNKAFVQLSIPIYQGGYTSARVEEAVLLLNAAQANEELADLQVRDRFEELWTQRESLYESVSVLKQALEFSRLYLASVQSSFEKGLKNRLDIVEAELKVKSIETQLYGSLYDMIANEAELLELTGQLTPMNFSCGSLS
ncbi:MAG: TolC family protein [Sulfuricurvum sp.]|nr:TolC family protein [Sulfuricurvum sp.]